MATKSENFTIPVETIKKLNDYSKESMIPKSRLVSHLLKKFFEEEEQKKENNA